MDIIINDKDKHTVKVNLDKALKGGSLSTMEVYGQFDSNYYETRYTPIMNENQRIIGVTILSANVTWTRSVSSLIS